MLAFLAVLTSGLFLTATLLYTPSEHKITGVPYFGIFNHAGDAPNSIIASVATIMVYWGDPRLSMRWLWSKLPSDLSAEKVKSFLETGGYHVEKIELSNERRIKRFLSRNIPLLVKSPGRTFVLYGYDTHTQSYIINHNLRGNDLIVSAAEYFPTNAVVLAVSPSRTIKKILAGPDPSRQAPPRKEYMDRFGEYWGRLELVEEYLLLGRQITRRAVFSRDEQLELAEITLEAMIKDPRFLQTSRIVKIRLLSLLARTELARGKPRKAGLILQEAIKFNFSLNEEEEDGWSGGSEAWPEISLPWLLLAKARVESGDVPGAKEAFLKAKTLPADPWYPSLTASLMEEIGYLGD